MCITITWSGNENVLTLQGNSVILCILYMFICSISNIIRLSVPWMGKHWKVKTSAVGRGKDGFSDYNASVIKCDKSGCSNMAKWWLHILLHHQRSNSLLQISGGPDTSAHVCLWPCVFYCGSALVSVRYVIPVIIGAAVWPTWLWPHRFNGWWGSVSPSEL